MENASPFGNAASIYTTSGAAADFFQTRFRAGMIGERGGIVHHSKSYVCVFGCLFRRRTTTINSCLFLRTVLRLLSIL